MAGWNTQGEVRQAGGLCTTPPVHFRLHKRCWGALPSREAGGLLSCHPPLAQADGAAADFLGTSRSSSRSEAP